MTFEQQLTERIVPFYLGEATDPSGRTLQQIWAWDFEALECAHDYIQWLFPLAEKSHFNPHAPRVTAAVVQAFRTDARLRQHLRQSFWVMLHFYGLAIADNAPPGAVVIEKAQHYPARQQEWVTALNHNYLRITRILKCLIAFGLKPEAHAFYTCLKNIYQEDRDPIGRETFQYWTEAVTAG